jgi:L-rhamnose isomerase
MPSLWQVWPHQGRMLQSKALQAQEESDLRRACQHDEECLEMAYNPASQVNKVWVRKDETIHPLRRSGLT